MKVNFTIDCTPGEARHVLGLPDLTPVHQVFVSRLQDVVSKTLTPSDAATLMTDWVSSSIQGAGAVQKAMWDVTRGSGAESRRKKPGG